jgi:hypothetical protein
MTDHVRRLYLAAGTLLAFFLAWAGIAAHPWNTKATAPNESSARAVALYEQRLQRDEALVQRLSQQSAAVPAPPVRIVTLPPLTTTRTS